jgi:DNA-binding CsgD family transcriptional regulator
MPLVGRKFEILAAIALAGRKFDAARANVSEGLTLLNEIDDPQATARLCWRGLQIEATRAERARARRQRADEDAALAIATALVERISLLAAGPSVTPEIDALFRTCRAEYARAEGSASAEAWLAAAAAWATLGEPYPDAYCRFHAAEAALAERKPKAEAAAFLISAHATATQLGAAPLLQAVESVARRARLALAPPTPPSPQRSNDGPAVKPFGLTAREIQVLRLVARGYTNPQIAEHLFISRKTAGAHVSNILAKLDVARRVEAAAIAERLDLLETP